MNRTIDLEKWLGDMAIGDFQSEAEIEDYFTLENCHRMWPNESIDMEEMDLACESVLARWRDFNAG